MRVSLLLAGLLCVGLAACGETGFHDPEALTDSQRNAADAWTVRSMTDTAINNAILTQHTLYPYHFETAGAGLNDLGQRDLGVLVEHYKGLGPKAPVAFPISVRRGSAPEALYDARVAAVKDALRASGLDAGRLQVTDTLPGGAGMPSDQAVQILLRQQNETSFTGSGSQAPAGGTGSGAAPDATK